jgi:hypothetical protein
MRWHHLEEARKTMANLLYHPLAPYGILAADFSPTVRLTEPDWAAILRRHYGRARVPARRFRGGVHSAVMNVLHLYLRQAHANHACQFFL